MIICFKIDALHYNIIFKTYSSNKKTKLCSLHFATSIFIKRGTKYINNTFELLNAKTTHSLVNIALWHQSLPINTYRLL